MSSTEDNDSAAQSLSAKNPQDRSLGGILVAAGRLSQTDREKITERQAQTGEQFSEAGKQLNLVKDADIVFALSQQFEYPYPIVSNSKVSKELVSAYAPFSAQVEALRGVRSGIALSWLHKSANHKAIAVVSPGRGEGRSWLAANLAVLFSQLGERTLLIDADLRNPRQHQLFGLKGDVGLSAVLMGLSGSDSIHRLPEFTDLSILPSGIKPPNPQEVISRPEFGLLIDGVSRNFDVVIIDTPALDEVADAQLIASRAGSALFVARKGKSRMAKLDHFSTLLQRSATNVVGSVLLD